MFNPYTILSPGVVKGAMLDRFLSAGFFRYGSNLFSTSFYPTTEGDIYSVFWLRYHVGKIAIDAKSQKIISKSNAFDVKISVFKPTEELEALHKKYQNHITFRSVDTVAELMVDVDNNFFDSRLLEVRDNGKLIAAGIFDQGANSIAGIKNIFDPEYKKYTPGKLLMLLKHQYCLQHQIQWYYPGYYIPEYPKFDYKLFLDKDATEVYLKNRKQWIDFRQFDIEVKKAMAK